MHSRHKNAVLNPAATDVWVGNRSMLQQSSWAAGGLAFQAENLEKSKRNPYLNCQVCRHMAPWCDFAVSRSYMETVGRVLRKETKLQGVVTHVQVRHDRKDASDCYKKGELFQPTNSIIQDMERRWTWNGLVILYHSFRIQRIKPDLLSPWLLKSGERGTFPKSLWRSNL